MPSTSSACTSTSCRPTPTGAPGELDSLSPDDKARLDRNLQLQADGTGYFILMATRPQTIGFALANSLAGQLAWIAEKFRDWTDPAGDAVDRDRVLTDLPIRTFAEGANNIVRWTEFDHGGHFAAMEQPELLIDDSEPSSAT